MAGRVAALRSIVVVARDGYLGSGASNEQQQALLEADVVAAIDRGDDVLLEGNFRPDTHAGMLERLFACGADVHAVYLDVSLAESLRRHAGRPQRITAQKMTELHPAAVPLGVPGEIVIPETSTVDETVAAIVSLFD